MRLLLLMLALLLPLGLKAQPFDEIAANRPKLKLESMCKDAQRGGQCFGCHRVVSNPKVWPQVAQSGGSRQRVQLAQLYSHSGGLER